MAHELDYALAEVLFAAAKTARPRANARAMCQAGATIRRLLGEIADMRAEHERRVKFIETATGRRVANESFRAGLESGFAEGVAVALDPYEPKHAATVAAWRAQRDPAAA